MNPKIMKGRNMKPKESLLGVLKNWRLIFNHNGGYGNIESI